MPFKSAAQRRFMFARHPEIAQRWAKEYGTETEYERIAKEKAWGATDSTSSSSMSRRKRTPSAPKG